MLKEKQDLPTIELSVIAPMYNEEENVERTVIAIQQELSAFASLWELLLVDDGSTDKTRQEVRRMASKYSNVRLVAYDTNYGRGRALRTGFSEAKGKYIVTIDFDLTYSASHILKLYNTLISDSKIDVVLGSAYMKGGKTQGVPFKRLLLSKLGNKVLQMAFNGEYKTVTCILRGYRREVIEALALDADGKELHLEILSKSIALGFKIKEVPATLTARKKGKTKSKLKRVTITHLVFSLLEKPMLLFSILGAFLLAGGIGFGLYISYLRYFNHLNPGRPLFYLVVILILVGVQLLSLAIIAGQNSMLRNEIFRLQSRVKKLEPEKETKPTEILDESE